MSMHRKSGKSRQVFISYRRTGGQAYAVSFLQGLNQVLGEGAVFLDVGHNAMEAGVSWQDSVREALDHSDTLLLVLDPGMTSHLADPQDAVRFELETAIQKGLRIAMVRVDEAEVPAAAALPDSLAVLPTLHSPAVHSDAVMADIERVIKDLTGRVPGKAKVIDGWDLAVLGTLAVVGVIAWVTKGAKVLNIDQTLLWGSALLAPWLVWMSARRAIPLGSRARTRRNLPQAASWLATGLLLSIPWSIAFARIYAQPSFAKQSGILVARFEGDPSDEHRDDFIEAIREEVQGLFRADSDSIVKALPYYIRSRSDARLHGAFSGASAVLWGTVTEPESSSPHVVAQLLLIERKSVYQSTGSFRGTLEKRDLTLGGDLHLMQQTLPRLLEGYLEYHAATDKLGYERALTHFGKALEVLEHDQSVVETALEDIVASLHFYKGSTYLLIGQVDSASAALHEAVRRSWQDGDKEWPTYIEAVNNLGWLLADRGQVERAIQELRRADRECGRKPALTACAYVWYNLGDAFLEVGRYDSASVRLNAAIARLDSGEREFDGARDSVAVVLRAYAHQSQSYGLVKQAIAGDSANHELLERAEDEWELGRGTLADAGLEIPDWFLITQARIHIARREWSEAIVLLSGLELEEEEYEWSARGLLAGAYHCVGEIDQALELMTSLLSTDPGAVEARAEATRISETCDAAS